MKNNREIFLMVDELSYSNLSKKHKQYMRYLGFFIVRYFDPVHFQNFTPLNSLIYSGLDYDSIQIISYKSYIKQNVFSQHSRERIKDILLKLYEAGIYTTILTPNSIYINKKDQPVLFISNGLYSKNFTIKHLYTQDTMKRKINSFVNSL